jgi:hypothetical protein
MPNPLQRATWTVVHDLEDDILRISPTAPQLLELIDVLIFSGGGITSTRAVWRLRLSGAVLRIEHAALA